VKLRKIFCPVNIDTIWRTQNNMDIDKLIEGADIVRFIKAQRIKWLGHIQRMDQTRPARKLFDWKPMGTRPVGRPRQRWQEDAMEDLIKLKIKNWKEIAKDRRAWRDLNRGEVGPSKIQLLYKLVYCVENDDEMFRPSLAIFRS
jgi:hypothetical protein